MHTKLSLALHLANLTIILTSRFRLQVKTKARNTSDALNTEVVRWRRCYTTGLFCSTDWNLFWDSSNGIEEYTTSVIGFINKCIDDIVPTVTVHTYPNQKQWITGNIHTELKGRAAAFKEGDLNPEAYNKSRYALRRPVNTGLRSNCTTPAPMLLGCDRACKL